MLGVPFFGRLQEMTRVHIFYADGSNRTIDTGTVSIQ